MKPTDVHGNRLAGNPEVRTGQNEPMIRGLGLYHPSSVIDPGSSSPLHVPSDHDFTGESVRMHIRHLREGANDPDAFAWVGLINPTRPEMALVAEEFGLESLQVEDATNPSQRAKFDVGTDGCVFALVKVLGYDESTSAVSTGQIAVFVGPGYAVTVRYGGHGDLAPVRARLAGSEALRAHGSLAVLYAVLDTVVDGYLAVVDEVVLDLHEVESEVFAPDPSSDVTRQIYELKRENIEVRRALEPLLPAAHRFATETADDVPEGLKPYFRDIGEHLLRAADIVDSTDNLLVTMLMASTALQDLQQNKDMRKISAYAAMGIVPTAIAGIYGMNFENMPELEWAFGYPLALGIMAGIMALLYRAFKKSGWL